MFENNIELNKKISNLFNLAFPELEIKETNIIFDHTLCIQSSSKQNYT